MSYDPNAESGSNKKGIVFFGATASDPKYDADVSNFYYDSQTLYVPNLNVSGTTTTINTTNTTIQDNLLELNSGATSNSNDSGFIIERGSTGDNAIFMWDESVDKFTLGTTTATASDTGDLTITVGKLVADLEGDVTGTIVVDEEVVDVSADSIYFLDATDSTTKKDTIADFIAGVAGTTANTSLSATSGVLTVEVDGTTVTRNGSGQLVASTLKTIGSVSAAATIDKDITLVTTSTNSFTVTLPASPDNGQVASVKKVDSGTGVVTISGNSGHTVDGGTKKLYYVNEAITMVYHSSTSTWYGI